MLTRADSAPPLWQSRGPAWMLNPAKWEPAQRSLALVTIIVAMTTLAAIALLPNTEEKAQVLLSQGRVEEAVALFERKREAAPLNPFETYSLASLYASQDRAADLVGLLEGEIARRPDSDWAHAMLISLYRGRGEIANEARILFHALMKAPSRAGFRRLIALYRSLSDRTGERTALEWARTEGLASPADSDRLTYLSSPEADAAASTEWRAASSHM